MQVKHTFKYEGSEPSRFLIFTLTDNTMNVRFLNDRTANQPTELYQTRITVDYSKDIIGTWESVSVTGDKNYEGVEARITYNADGTYTYRQKSDGEWIDLGNTDTEYFVDGNFLATRWKNKGEDTYSSECWIIKAIKLQLFLCLHSLKVLVTMLGTTKFRTCGMQRATLYITNL